MANNFNTNVNNELYDKESAWQVQQRVSSSAGYSMYAYGQWPVAMTANPLQPEDTMRTPGIFASGMIPRSGSYDMNTTGPTADGIRNNRFANVSNGAYASSESPNADDNNALAQSGTGGYHDVQE